MNSILRSDLGLHHGLKEQDTQRAHQIKELTIYVPSEYLL